MKAELRAVEATGTVDENGQVHLDRPLPPGGPDRVRVLLLFSEARDIDEQLWLAAGARNAAFDFLNDPVEDVYSTLDGKPFGYEG